MGYFSEDNKISIASTTTDGAAAATAIASSAIDMAGFDGCCFIIPIGTIVTNGVQSVKAQQSADSGGSPDDFSDLTGTSITIADDDDNKLRYIDVYRPTKRYLKVVISRATQNSTYGGIIAIQYRGRRMPVTHGTNVSGEQWSSAAEGTA